MTTTEAPPPGPGPRPARPLRVFVIAGEPSGDLLGAAVISALRELRPGLALGGIGGEALAGQGLQSLFPMSDLSVMGLAEVLPRLPLLFRRRDEAVAACLAAGPDVLLTIDSPDFCLRVARRVRASDPSIRTVHYVAPSVWAWRPGRAVKMARFIDHVLALLPFEPPYMEAAGMACDFVGHPVVAMPRPSEEEARALRAELAIGPGPMVLALPGSRAGEVARLARPFGAALARLGARHPGLKVVLPVAGPVLDQVRAATADWPIPPILLLPANDPDGRRKRAAFAAADVALAASGTVALELAAVGTPMVTAYEVSPLTRLIVTAMARIDRVNLVNIVDDSRHVPELLGRDCRPETLAAALEAVLSDPGPQKAAMARVMQALGEGGAPPGDRAARAILGGL